MLANLDDRRCDTNLLANFWDEEKEEASVDLREHCLTQPISSIQEFYKDQTVFITGATGFLGSLLVEKLLRCCPQVRKLIILVRKKRSQSVEERVKAYFSDAVFDRLRLSNPDYHKKVDIVCGQLDADDFGVTPSDAQRLTSQTSIVFHIAATVRFDEHIRTAYTLNVKGTKTVISFARKMSRLKSFVYVSTAFSNCDRQFIEETFYPPTFAEKQLSTLLDFGSDEELAILNDLLIGRKPNTYTMTKATAEDLIREAAQDLPVCVFRPSIVFPTLQEPMPLWTKGFNAVLAICVVSGIGLNRVALIHPDVAMDIVPADLTINAITALAWYQSTVRPDQTVFNYVSYNDNRVTMRYFMDVGMNTLLSGEESCNSVLWVPHLCLVKSAFIYYALFYMLHFIPAIVFSLGEKLTRRKPRVLKLYRKIFFLSKISKYFSLNEWAFSSENSRSMVSAMCQADRRLFPCSMSGFRWEFIFENTPRSSTLYLLKERMTKEHFQSKVLLILWFHCCLWLAIKAIALYLVLGIVAKQVNCLFIA